MRTKTIKRLGKSVVIGILTVAMVMAVVVTPRSVKAAEGEVTVGEIKYVPMTKDQFTECYVTNNKEVPTYNAQESYIFGGWYLKKQGVDTITTSDDVTAIAEGDTVTADTVYAKFVPAYVLSMKGQNGTMSSDTNTTMRLVSSVDCLDYKEVGYDILINNDESKKITNAKTTKVYNSLTVKGKSPYSASQVFGPSSQYFITWRIYNIPNNADAQATKVYVRPYWITKDGTKVNGLAKYLHVEDGMYGYVNVPINLYTGEAVAAGVLTMDYSAISMNYEVYDVEYDRVFGEMEYDDKGDSVKIVGNVKNIDEVAYANDLYACVRFKVKEGKTGNVTIGDDDQKTFAIDKEDFCDNAENPCTGFKAWDVKY